MPDRELLLERLERLAIVLDELMPQCAELVRDAIALLKKQEVVEPKKVKGYNPPMYTVYEYECEKCKSPMMSKQPFCMGCGKAVKWDEL